MLRLTVKQVIKLHTQVVMATGGSDGIRDMGLLESAVNAPFQSFGGYDVYPTIYEKAARLGFGLAQNHAFIDGNKRIAAHALMAFLELNNIEIDCTEFELFSVFYKLAASEVTFDDLVDWIKKHEAPKN
ncbi:MAG: type II toxin-antitoxin system death-on-curing family toxin [Synergistaceae bacterium]|nr:type II toxin-antitoxin system death-on-curing family toxin [Synergistaceae bacterium]MBR0167458.1 type II toxin-antitoxin system death-on-curing family toxin [Synergistaceae bacterium]